MSQKKLFPLENRSNEWTSWSRNDHKNKKAKGKRQAAMFKKYFNDNGRLNVN